MQDEAEGFSGTLNISSKEVEGAGGVEPGDPQDSSTIVDCPRMTRGSGLITSSSSLKMDLVSEVTGEVEGSIVGRGVDIEALHMVIVVVVL